MKTETKHVSLWIWGIVIAVLVLLFAYMEKAYQQDKDEFQMSQKDREYLLLERFGHKTTNNRIVVFGTSLVKFGLPYDGEMEKLLEDKGHLVDFVRLTIPNNNLAVDVFEQISNYILSSHPNFIFLQVEPFFLELKCTQNKKAKKRAEEIKRIFDEHKKKSQQQDIPNHKIDTKQIAIEQKKNKQQYLNSKGSSAYLLAENIARGISARTRYLIGRKLLSIDSDGDMLFHQTNKQYPNNQDDSIIAAKLDQVGNVEYISSCSYNVFKPHFNSSVETFLKQASEQGTKIVLLEMGRSIEAENTATLEERQLLATTLNEVSENYQIPLWQFTEKLSVAEYYRDRAHLNNKGRAVFTHWFIEKLIFELNHDSI